uniref:Uncharacterized protein n=1 Tax=Rhizophora mucronata TaxID=61149 RepID=A0A2P2PRF0_RHIMU
MASNWEFPRVSFKSRRKMQHN